MAKGIKKVKSKTGKIYYYDQTKYTANAKKRISKEGKLTLVGKNGRVNNKNIDKYKQEIIENEELAKSEKVTLLNQIDAIAKNAHKNKEKLTVQSLEARAAETTKEKMIINTGYDYEDFLTEYNFYSKDWESEANWDNDIYTDPITKKRYRFIFNYTGSVLKEIV